MPSLLSGCSGAAGNADDPSTAPAATPTAAAKAADDTSQLWKNMRKTVDRPAVALQAPANLKPTAGYERADVEALANRAVDVLARSSRPRLSAMNPSAAINYVYANQYAATTNEFKQETISATGGLDWQWVAASRYPQELGKPSEPKTIKVTAAVSSGRDTIDDGTTATYLTVTLQAHIVQTVETPQFGRVPIVVRRTVRASSFKPRGGPDWWPSVTTRTVPFGNTVCGLFQGAVLQPLKDPADLRRDIASLKDSLATRGVTPQPTATKPDELREEVRDECE